MRLPGFNMATVNSYKVCMTPLCGISQRMWQYVRVNWQVYHLFNISMTISCSVFHVFYMPGSTPLIHWETVQICSHLLSCLPIKSQSLHDTNKDAKKSKILSWILIINEHKATCSPNGKHQPRWKKWFPWIKSMTGTNRWASRPGWRGFVIESLIGIRDEARR